MTTSRIPRSLATLACVAFGVALLGACGDESAHPPIDDVNGRVACELDAAGVVRAEATVTNHSSKTSTYVIEIELHHDHGTETNGAVVENVEPGADAIALTAFTDTPEGEVRCEVAAVERFKA